MFIYTLTIDYAHTIASGLAIVFAEDPKGQISGTGAVEAPKDWKELCPKWESLKSGKQYSLTDYE